jgi:signal peptidase I
VVTVTLLVLVGFLGAAWLRDWTFHIVGSGSMAPAIPKDSVAAVSPVNGRDIVVGDVVAFSFADRPDVTVIHRVVERIEQGGVVYFRTKGDANAQADLRLVPAAAVQGEVTFDLPGTGVVARQLHPPWTWLVLVGGPLALLAVGELRRSRRRRVGPDPEAERLAGDRAWLPPFSPTRGGVTQTAQPPAGATPLGHRARPLAHRPRPGLHESYEDT